MRSLKFILITLGILLSSVLIAQEKTNSEKKKQSNTNTNVYNNTRNSNTLEINKAEVEDAEESLDELSQPAWLDYYQSSRDALTTPGSNDITPANQLKLDLIVSQIEVSAPNSFEYHYIKYWNSANDTAEADHLRTAYNIAPSRAETWDDFIDYYELTDSISKKNSFCKKIYNGKIFSSEIYDYAENVLNSMENNAILITNGSIDTYPVWILQYMEKKGKKVTVLNLDLMEKDYYFKKKMKSLGLIHLAHSSFLNDKAGFFRHLASNNTAKNIYFSLTLDHKLIRGLKDILYTTGLTMKLSSSDFDNIKELKKNYKAFDLVNLRNDNISRSYEVKQLQSNYLMPMILLYNHYKENNYTKIANEIRDLMLKIAGRAGKKEQIEAMMQN